MPDKRTPLGDIVEEQKAYESKRDGTCGLSWIEPRADLTRRGDNVSHAMPARWPTYASAPRMPTARTARASAASGA